MTKIDMETKRGLTREMKNMVRSMIASTEELKRYQGALSGNSSVSGNVANVTGNIVEGSDTTNRVGTVIIVKSLKFRLQATINASATSDRFRIVVFSDTSQQNSAPSITDVLQSASVTAFTNLVNAQSGRIKILFDRTYQMNTAGSAGFTSSFACNVKNLRVYFPGSTGNLKNSIYVAYISDTPTNLCTFAYAYEVLFTDA